MEDCRVDLEPELKVDDPPVNLPDDDPPPPPRRDDPLTVIFLGTKLGDGALFLPSALEASSLERLGWIRAMCLVRVVFRQNLQEAKGTRRCQNRPLDVNGGQRA